MSYIQCFINFAIGKIRQNLTTLLVKSYHVETDRTKLKLKILQKFKHFINILNPMKQGRYKEHSALSDKEICSSCHNMGILNNPLPLYRSERKDCVSVPLVYIKTNHNYMQSEIGYLVALLSITTLH